VTVKDADGHVEESTAMFSSLEGEYHIVLASDYPHADSFREENMVKAIMDREDVPLRVREKLLSANAQSLYGL